MRRLIRITLGVTSMLLGLVGLVMPFLQGWLFLALGAVFLSEDIPFFTRLVDWIENRIPPLKKPVGRLRDYLRDSDKPDGP